MCSPVKGRKDPLHVTYGGRETVSSLSHSTADHGEPSLYLASASEESVKWRPGREADASCTNGLET